MQHRHLPPSASSRHVPELHVGEMRQPPDAQVLSESMEPTKSNWFCPQGSVLVPLLRLRCLTALGQKSQWTTMSGVRVQGGTWWWCR